MKGDLRVADGYLGTTASSTISSTCASTLEQAGDAEERLGGMSEAYEPDGILEIDANPMRRWGSPREA
jgi:hypothetical protein